MEFKKYKKQYIIVAIICTGQLLVGYVLGWTAPVIPKLQKIDKTPLKDVISDIDAAWLGSVLYFGCTTGPFVASFISNRLGRRPCLFLGGLIALSGFVVLGFAKNLAMIFAGRIITGVSNGFIFVTNLVYIGEIASPHMRGILLTMTGVSTTLGCFIVYCVGPFVPYMYINWVAAFIASVFVVGFFLLVPETPLFQAMIGKHEDAIANLKSLGRENDIENVFAAASMREASAMAQFTEIYTMKSNRKALLIILVLNILQQLSGIITVIFFVTTIFDLTGSDIESYVSTIIVGFTQIVAACVAPVFVDKTGRKSLLLISTAGCALSLTTMGIYFYLYNTKNPAVNSLQWLSLSSLIIYFLAFNIGFGIIPNTFIGEMFTANVRSFGSSFTVSVGWIFGFGVATAFGYMVPVFGAHSTFWMYAAACIIAFLFTLIVVPETKGKTLLEIVEILSR